MNNISNENSHKNFLKYKEEYEYDILIENKYLIHEDQREQKLTKKVLDELYENKLINKDYYTTEIEKLKLKLKYQKCKELFYDILTYIIYILILLYSIYSINNYHLNNKF